MGTRTSGPRAQWKITIPEELAREISLIFFDLTHQKPEYGARSQLVVALLQRWLNEGKLKLQQRKETEANGRPSPDTIPAPTELHLGAGSSTVPAVAETPGSLGSPSSGGSDNSLPNPQAPLPSGGDQ